MQLRKSTISALLLLCLALTPGSLFGLLHFAYGSGPTLGTYTLNAVPSVAQEGNSVSLLLTVSGFTSTTPIIFSFRFNVRDPAGIATQSSDQNYTTAPGQSEFTIVVYFPTSSFPGRNSLAGKYTAWVDELAPISSTQIATTTFALTITDSSSYERTLTVNIRATGYNASESVTITIRTQTTSTLVFSHTLASSTAGIVTDSWPIPKNATIDNYSVSIAGTSTFKSPPDTQLFFVRTANMAIQSITSSKSSYQRTDTMSFSFQPKYPDGSSATSGAALLTLTRPDRANVTLAATYDLTVQAFVASYTTTTDNETGTWTASLSGHSYGDPYGNTGPGPAVTSSSQLNPATLSVTVVTSGTIFNVGQMIRLNATIDYPDETPLRSGSVGAYLLYNANQQTVNDTVSIVYDSGLMLWVGTYTPKTSDVGGVWSLVVKASDGALPTNSGSAQRAITIQNSATTPGNSPTLPSYYFGLLAALIAGLIAVGFLAFRRKRETHARLKIDLEAVQSEASKIEGQEFFKSVKDQLKNKKDADLQ